MGISSLDLEIQAVLRMGFDYIRAHVDDSVDEIFSNLKSDHMKNMYGDHEIKHIKQWGTENDIPVLNAWSLNPQKAPCVSIHIAQTTEDTSHAFLSDHAGIDVTEKTPRTIVPEFVPTGSAERDYGTLMDINFPSSVDLGELLVRPGNILHDAKGEDYQIQKVETGIITILLLGGDPDLRKVTVRSFIDQTRKKTGQAYFQEQVDIGIHGHADSNTVMWMYYMTAWIFLRFKPEIERRCMDLTTWSATDFKRDSQYLGDNIFSRWMRLSARTQSVWSEDPYDEIDTLVAQVNLPEVDDC